MKSKGALANQFKFVTSMVAAIMYGSNWYDQSCAYTGSAASASVPANNPVRMIGFAIFSFSWRFVCYFPELQLLDHVELWRADMQTIFVSMVGCIGYPLYDNKCNFSPFDYRDFYDMRPVAAAGK